MKRISNSLARLHLRAGVPLAVFWLGTGISLDAATSLFWVTALYTYLITRKPPLEVQ